MENKVLMLGLYPANVDPNTHREFREVCHTKNGTIYGAYTRELTWALEKVIDVLERKLEVKELIDPEACLLLTHTTNNGKTHIMRKNERTDLTELAINNVNIEVSNRVKHSLIDHYGTKYGSLSYLMNQAMELYVKLENGFVKLVETIKKPVNSFICDNKGQVTSIDTDMVFEAIELLNLKVDNLKQHMERTVKDTVQSTLNIIPKTVNRAKKIISGTVKSANHDDKFKKAVSVLENVMKWNEHGFTLKEYHRSLVKLTSQGDMRTVRSDLAMLEADNRIKKIRNSAHGTATYHFIDNNQYYQYNTELAKTKFFKVFKEAFQDADALTVQDLNELIFNKYGLFDAKSQYKHLKWLLLDGYVTRHPVNPKLLFVKK